MPGPDLFSARRELARKAAEPLAVRMRPRTLDELQGQEHILGPGKLLRRMLEADAITSLILHGPPGTGKTTLAELIASYTRRHFERENASSVGVKRIREIIDDAQRRLETSQRRTILFLDEIHRFSKSQQDVLLADVERGILTLVGATTENPLFAVNSALVSRSTLFRLEPLSESAITAALRRALSDPDRGFGKLPIHAHDDALHVWALKSDGDARRALTALEVAVLSQLKSQSDPAAPLHITRQVAEDSIQQKAAVYDAAGDEHYDTISAFIKSVRGSDPDAAIYWLARMLEGGEDPRFIARRLAILASEDIGNANPQAVSVAAATWELVERIGMPEARINLAQCTTYLALSSKSNAAYNAIESALADVREGRTLPVPMYIKDGNVRKAVLRSASGRAGSTAPGAATGESYDYAHDHPDAVGRQDYLGVDKRYYLPTAHGLEKQLAERLEEVRKIRAAIRPPTPPPPPLTPDP